MHSCISQYRLRGGAGGQSAGGLELGTMLVVEKYGGQSPSNKQKAALSAESPQSARPHRWLPTTAPSAPIAAIHRALTQWSCRLRHAREGFCPPPRARRSEARRRGRRGQQRETVETQAPHAPAPRTSGGNYLQLHGGADLRAHSARFRIAPILAPRFAILPG